MTSDHYISQTYLSPFCGQDGMLQRYFKDSISVEATRRVPTKSVCCKRNWDNNSLLSDPQAVQKFLRYYENRWNESVDKVISGYYSSEAKEVLAGYIFYMQAMSPLGRKKYGDIAQKTIDYSYDILSKKDKSTLTQDDIKFIDEYKNFKLGDMLCHALMVRMLHNYLPHDTYTSAKWQILRNNTDVPFITSDHPVCLLDPEDAITRTYVPLTPRAGLIITPIIDNIQKSRSMFELEGKIHIPIDLDDYTEVRTKYVKTLNVLVIKTAEILILTSEKNSGLHKAVKKWGHCT